MASHKYFITVSPPYDKSNSTNSALHKYYTQRIQLHFNKFSKHYMFYPEYSENSRLHYHGIVKIDDLCKFHHIRKQMTKELGIIDIQLIKSFEEHLRSLTYSMKNWAAMQYIMTPIMPKRKKRVIKLEILPEVENDIRKWFPTLI